MTTRREKSTEPRNSNHNQINRLLDLIEIERANLARADSLLGCLKVAMEYGDADTHRRPYYPDVVEIARELVRGSVNALDSIHLPEFVADEIKEETDLAGRVTVSEQMPVAPTFSNTQAVIFPRAKYMRIHRRDYSRASRCSTTSNAASASAKISG
jgi:hypothetical protein